MRILLAALATCMSILLDADGPALSSKAFAAESDAILASIAPDMVTGGNPPLAAQRCETAASSGLRKSEYESERPKSVVELQQFRKTVSIQSSRSDGTEGTAKLTNLNPIANSWFLLELAWKDDKEHAWFHLENPLPASRQVFLDSGYSLGLSIVNSGETTRCDLWNGGKKSALYIARASGDPYVSLCGGQLFLRNQVRGQRSTQEWVSDLLRDRVWGGEAIISEVKTDFMKDAFLSTSELEPVKVSDPAAQANPPGAPPSPEINPAYREFLLSPHELGLGTTSGNGKMLVGKWYATRHQPGVSASVIEPGLVSDQIKRSINGKILPLDEIESKALVYLVSFDLSDFNVKFALGTDHPAVDWSDRVQTQVFDPILPGPDGIKDLSPLARTGMISPADMHGTVATFTGGFKRHHGAFRFTKLSLQNYGSHYGFIEDGVVLSKLQPELATFLTWSDGTVELKTWTEADNAGLHCIQHARQNGVPLIDYNPVTGVSLPGEYVRQIRVGNWSGAQDNNRRTVRAGLCLQEHGGERFLTYAYFSSATPSAMAQVFQAYGCKYAMHLDMNALEHTYMALYHGESGNLSVEHLVRGMEVLDKEKGQTLIPRFLGMADNRDFFYLTRKEER